MPYGGVKIDNITFTNAGVDTNITVSGLYASTTSGLTVTGAILAGAGSAAAPSFSFGSDPDSGLYSAGANQLAISTGGTGRLFVDASGRLGLGTSSPVSLFHIAGGGTGRNGALRFSDAGGTNYWEIGRDNAVNGSFTITQNGTERLCIDYLAGNVGIGTASPGALLDVAAGIKVNSAGSVTSGFSNGVNMGGYDAIGYDANDIVLGGYRASQFTGLRFYTAGSERGRFDSSGRFLVGTSSSPSVGNGQYALAVIQGTAGTPSGPGSFSLQRGEGAATITSGEGIAYVNFNDNAGNTFATFACEADANAGASDFPGRLVFSVTADGAASPTERVRITSAGNVGIGTPSPTNYGAGINTLSINGTAGSIVDFYYNGTRQGFIGTLASNQMVVDTAGAAIPLTLKTNNTNALTIDTSQRVGIGTTGPQSRLEVNDTGVGSVVIPLTVANQDTSSSGTGAGIGFVVDGVSDVIGAQIAGVRTGSAYHQSAFVVSTRDQSGGGLLERLRVDSSGRVGIGTTGPQEKLEIQDGSISVGSSANISQTNTLIAGYGYILSGTKYGNTSIRSTYNNANNLSSLEFYTSSSATASTERARIDSSGRLLIGTSTARSNFFNSTFSPSLQVEGATYDTTMVSIVSNGLSSSSNFVLAKSRGSLGSNTIVANNDSLGVVNFQGNDGSEFVGAATIAGEVDGTPGADDMPGRLVFSTTADGAASPTERMRIDSTGLMTLAGPGIKFPATQVASSDPNTLDDYEEGTFTPTVIGSSTAGTASYSAQFGSYTKIGRQVSIIITLDYSGGTGTGNLRVAGLPFTSANTNNQFPIASLDLSDIATTAGTTPSAVNVFNTSTIIFNQMLGGVGTATNIPYDAAGGIYLSMTYFT